MVTIFKTIPAVPIPDNFFLIETSPNTSPVIPARQVKGSMKKNKTLIQERGKNITPITKDAIASPSDVEEVLSNGKEFVFDAKMSPSFCTGMV